MSDHDTDRQRCGGTGMVAYWDGSAYAGEMCRGCIDCEPSEEQMNDTWHSGDIDAAKADLLAAGWIQRDVTIWEAPDGSRHRGPAVAWRTMKRAQNDEAVGVLAQQRATFDTENAAAEARIKNRSAPIELVRQRVGDFNEGYRAGYDDGQLGNASDPESARDTSKASAELADLPNEGR